MQTYPENRLRLLQDSKPDQLLIHEIYRSIQGESHYAGWPCVFVRTSVCGQRCTWCDTPHAFTQGEWIPIADIITKVASFQTRLVELTGGEPLLQHGTIELMSELCRLDYKVLLETGGAESLEHVPPGVHVIMDLKCPDSGEAERNYWPNLDLLKKTDEIKFVIASVEDFTWTIKQITENNLHTRFQVLVSAVFGKVTLADLATWVLDSGLPIRMQLQMHKFIWDPQARGV
ncbi:MAG: radical SAM protein [Zavarzinella sp.]